MSSIAFTSPSGEIRISGRERAMMGTICNQFRAMQMGDFEHQQLNWVERVTASDHYLHAYAIELRRAKTEEVKFDIQRRLAKALDTYFHVGYDNAILLAGQPVDLFCLALNSAISWGNRAVQLCAKLHGQCEIHAYCEGEDRAWLAGLVDEAVGAGVFRPEPYGYDGWGKLAEFLRSSADHPVVTSYSVTDSFPNPSFAPDDLRLDADDPWEAWAEFSGAQHWEWGMAKLRADTGLRISPDELGRLFDNGLTGTGFMRAAQAMSAGTAKTEGLGATPASAVRQDAP